MLKIVMVASLATAVLAAATAAEADRRTFKAKLTGDQEVTMPPGGVDTETTGRIKIEIDRAETKGEFILTVNDGLRVTQAHLHCAPRGQNGPIVVFLAGFHDRGWDVDGKWVSNATFTQANITNTSCGATIAELVQAMRDGRVYANVHTVLNPGGEVRGQIEAEDDD